MKIFIRMLVVSSLVLFGFGAAFAQPVLQPGSQPELLPGIQTATPAETPPGAQAEKWQVDKDHSNIYFEIRHTYAMVRGQFNDFTGNVNFNPESPETSSVEFEVKTASVDTEIIKRDEHLRTADFFDAAKYPVMTFKSESIKPVSGDKYEMKGDLTVKDVTKSVTLPFTYFGMRENPIEPGTQVAGFETEFTINRLEYHVGTGKFFETGVVGDKVNVLVTLELLKKGAPEQAQ